MISNPERNREETTGWETTTRFVLVIIMGIGVSVMIGWHVGWPAPVFLIPGTIPMNYNTALCFLLLGAGSYALATGRFHRFLAPAVGAALVLLSLLAILQSATGQSFGLDLFSPWPSEPDGVPGRMPLPTAVSFLGSGGALLAVTRRRKSPVWFAVAQTVVLGLGLISTSAYLVGLTNLSMFGLGIQMAFPTALAFVAYGIVMLAYIWRQCPSEEEGVRRWGPAIATMAVLIFFVSFGASSEFISPLEKVLELAAGGVITAVLGFSIYRLTNLKIAYKGLVLIALPLLFVLLFVALVIRMKREYEESQSLVAHTKEVITTAQSLWTQLANAQYVLRAYVVTGLPNMAEPYYVAAQEAPRTLARLQGLVRDDPLQSARAAEMAVTAQGRLTLYAEIERLMREGRKAEAVEQLRNSYSRPVWEDLYQDIGSFIAYEEHLDEQRQGRVARSWKRLNWLLAAETLAALMLAVMLVVLFGRGISARLQTLMDNARSLSDGRALSAPLTGADEIAQLDQVFHQMAKSIEEATLKERAISQYAQDFICSIDASGTFVKANPATLKIFGYHPEELIGRHFLDLVAPDEVEASLVEFQALRLREAVNGKETRCLRQDGSVVHMLWSATWSDLHQLLFCVARDITERKRGEEARQAYAAEIHDLYNQAPCGYHSLGSDGTFLQINDTELTWLGYAREEVIGKLRFQDLLTPESRQIFYESFETYKQRGWVNDLEFQIYRKDGSSMTVLLNATAIKDADGRYLSGRSTLFDITERKQADDKIKRLNQDLERRATQVETANRELESFSYSVSHDLRAPLRHIDGFVGLLKKNRSSMDEKSQRYLQIISESAKHMGRLIDDLLSFSRMGRAEMQHSVVSMQELLKEVQRELGKEAAGRSIEWKVGRLPAIQADPAMLRLVFINLLSNAIKYTRPREEAVIEIGSDCSRPDAVAFYVRDNGVGFDMRYIDKLFGVFQRLHRADEFEGTGIGLANVRRIIHRHGGETWAEGRVGSGATFYFSLPTPRRPEADSGAEGVAQTDGPSWRSA